MKRARRDGVRCFVGAGLSAPAELTPFRRELTGGEVALSPGDADCIYAPVSKAKCRPRRAARAAASHSSGRELVQGEGLEPSRPFPARGF